MEVDGGAAPDEPLGHDGPNDHGGQEEPGAVKLYIDIIGGFPEQFGPEGRVAWDRERARGWVTSTKAHTTLRFIDGPCTGYSFFRKMVAMPEARVPMRADRSESITVVRHVHEVGYVVRFKEERVKALAGSASLPAAPSGQYVIKAPPFLGYDGFQPARQYLVTNRHHRDKHRIFVDWHQQE
eukprot:contig_1919_g314